MSTRPKKAWYDGQQQPPKAPRRDLITPEQKAKRRSRGGARGSRANIARIKLEQVFAEMDAEGES